MTRYPRVRTPGNWLGCRSHCASRERRDPPAGGGSEDVPTRAAPASPFPQGADRAGLITSPTMGRGRGAAPCRLTLRYASFHFSHDEVVLPRYG